MISVLTKQLLLPHSTYSGGWVEGCSGHHIPLGTGAGRDSVSTQVSMSTMAEKKEHSLPLLLPYQQPEQATDYMTTTKEEGTCHLTLCLGGQLKHGIASLSATNYKVSGVSLATTKQIATRILLPSALKETDTVLPIRHFTN